MFRKLTAFLLLAFVTGTQAQTIRYIHTDALGSVAVVTDANRNVVDRREYEPYGQQLSGAVSDGPGYTGHVQDVATGLSYMQQRYYDSQIGRFLSVDPVTAYSEGDMRLLGRYGYGFDNPYRFTDPDGRESWANTGTTNPWPTVRDACSESSSCEQQVAWNLSKTEAGMLAGLSGGRSALSFVRTLSSVILKAVRNDAKPNGIPENWAKIPSKKGGGEIFRNPENKHDQVRTMPGNPNSSNPAQQRPYVVRQADGKNYGADGKEVPGNSPEAHIPIENFKFMLREELLKINR